MAQLIHDQFVAALSSTASTSCEQNKYNPDYKADNTQDKRITEL